jgi:hypothetical protein
VVLKTADSTTKSPLNTLRLVDFGSAVASLSTEMHAVFLLFGFLASALAVITPDGKKFKLNGIRN